MRSWRTVAATRTSTAATSTSRPARDRSPVSSRSSARTRRFERWPRASRSETAWPSRPTTRHSSSPSRGRDTSPRSTSPPTAPSRIRGCGPTSATPHPTAYASTRSRRVSCVRSAMRASARRRRGTSRDRDRTLLLRVHARWRGRKNAVHRGGTVARRREHGSYVRVPYRTSSHRRCVCAAHRMAVEKRDGKGSACRKTRRWSGSLKDSWSIVPRSKKNNTGKISSSASATS
jgi:hypothetical protein